MTRFLLRWLAHLVAIPVALALCFAILVAVSYMHDTFGGYRCGQTLGGLIDGC